MWNLQAKFLLTLQYIGEEEVKNLYVTVFYLAWTIAFRRKPSYFQAVYFFHILSGRNRTEKQAVHTETLNYFAVDASIAWTFGALSEPVPQASLRRKFKISGAASTKNIQFLCALPVSILFITAYDKKWTIMLKKYHLYIDK